VSRFVLETHKKEIKCVCGKTKTKWYELPGSDGRKSQMRMNLARREKLMSKRTVMVDNIPQFVISLVSCVPVLSLPANDSVRFGFPISQELTGLKITSGLLIGGEIPKTGDSKQGDGAIDWNT